jgi:hypothetical protein
MPNRGDSRLYQALGRIGQPERIHLGLDCAIYWRQVGSGFEGLHPDPTPHVWWKICRECSLCRDEVIFDSVSSNEILKAIVTHNHTLQELLVIDDRNDMHFANSPRSSFRYGWSITRDRAQPSGFVGKRTSRRVKLGDTSMMDWRQCSIQILRPHS